MYRLIIMLGLLSLLIFMGLFSSFSYNENSYDLKINNIEYIHISTLGNAFDFGDAQNAAGYSCNSNGHGGL